jgi:hypothetical protein
MPDYYANKNAQDDGYHEVHIDNGSCSHPPETKNRDPLGWHASCSGAVAEAKRRYGKADGCFYCVPSCNTR